MHQTDNDVRDQGETYSDKTPPQDDRDEDTHCQKAMDGPSREDAWSTTDCRKSLGMENLIAPDFQNDLQNDGMTAGSQNLRKLLRHRS